MITLAKSIPVHNLLVTILQAVESFDATFDDTMPLHAILGELTSLTPEAEKKRNFLTTLLPLEVSNKDLLAEFSEYKSFSDFQVKDLLNLSRDSSALPFNGFALMLLEALHDVEPESLQTLTLLEILRHAELKNRVAYDFIDESRGIFAPYKEMPSVRMNSAEVLPAVVPQQSSGPGVPDITPYKRLEYFGGGEFLDLTADTIDPILRLLSQHLRSGSPLLTGQLGNILRKAALNESVYLLQNVLDVPIPTHLQPASEQHSQKRARKKVADYTFNTLFLMRFDHATYSLMYEAAVARAAEIWESLLIAQADKEGVSRDTYTHTQSKLSESIANLEQIFDPDRNQGADAQLWREEIMYPISFLKNIMSVEIPLVPEGYFA